MHWTSMVRYFSAGKKIYIRRRWRRGKIGKPKTPASDSYVALTAMSASCLEVWRKETPYAKNQIGCLHRIKRTEKPLGSAACWFGITFTRQPRELGSFSSDRIAATWIPLGSGHSFRVPQPSQGCFRLSKRRQEG